MSFDIVEIVEKNLINEMKEAIKKGIAINAKDEFGYTPLHTAIANQHTDMALLLLEAGANGSTQDNEGFTSLHYSIEHYNENMLNVVNYLLKSTPKLVHVEDNYGAQALASAVLNGDVSVAAIKLLLEAGADKNHNSEIGASPLNLVESMNIEELKKLFSRF